MADRPRPTNVILAELTATLTELREKRARLAVNEARADDIDRRAAVLEREITNGHKRGRRR